MKNSYDCVVVGGGPAGSTVAALVAQAGPKTLLLEREKFPRFHVGESLMPETYWTFQRLGVLDRLKSSSFVKKMSVQFVNASGKSSNPFYFKQHDPRECSQTWQVDRSKFDELLLENATEKGAECCDGIRVLNVLFSGNGRATGVGIVNSEGEKQVIRARVVVDATGQQSLIASGLGIRRIHPYLRKAAIWNYFRGAYRDTGDHAGGTVILHTQNKQAWFWMIPLENHLTSVGVVSDHDLLLKSGGSVQQMFQAQLAVCPSVAKRLTGTQPTRAFHIAKEFSYSSQQAAGAGWVLVGDAWGFIDPIYSSGVFFALKSGEMAADCVVHALSVGDCSAAQLGRWSDEFAGGTKCISKLVDAFYTEGFSISGFLRQYPQHQGSLTDLLIGRVFRPGASKIFNDMIPYLAAIKKNHL